MAIGTFKLPQNTPYYADDWIRPTDWLTMPTIGSQEFIGLLAVTDDESNHIALLCAGAYTVDWGDGTSENVATGVKAQHSYTYSSISNSTISTRGYKQVLVRVTPQAGQNLTTVNLQQQNSILAKTHVTQWLDIDINGSSINTLTLGGTTIRVGSCERVNIGTIGTLTTCANIFSSFFSLKKINVFNTASSSSFSGAFSNCTSLLTVPLLNTVSSLNFSDTFSSCNSLRTIPLLNTSNSTTFSNFLSGCISLQTIPLLNTSSGTSFNRMFFSCLSLQTLPNLNTSSGTTFTDTLLSDSSLAKGAFQGTRYTISYTAMCLSQSAIVDIFNGLGTAVGTPTITVSNNPGYAGLTAAEKLIATNKGFTIA